MKALLLACAIVLSAGIIAHAGATDPIKGCYAKKGGALRVLGIGGCKSTEVAISWNQQGPVGPQGEAGEASTATFTILSDTITPPADETVHTIVCPDGMTPLAATGWITVTPIMDEYGEPMWDDEAGTYLLLTRVYASRVELEMRNWAGYWRPTTLTWHVTCGAV